jgi:hypothetical protein
MTKAFELPIPHWLAGHRGLLLENLFTATQLRVAVDDALEAAAKIAATPITGEQDDITMEAKDRVAAAIRAMKQQTPPATPKGDER